jgi:antibiotic biosynthesis monooxygenase (ABM) superfamily enzyme
MTPDAPHPVLLIELPVPPGREAEWNEWYEGEHIPDFLATVDGAVRSTRYRIIGDSADGISYLVVHEFASTETLSAFHDSPVMNDRLGNYTERWGMPPIWRRRGFAPTFRAEAPR